LLPPKAGDRVPDVDPVDFPVLGLPDDAWPGTSRLAMRTGSRPRLGPAAVGPLNLLFLVHAYYLPGEKYPALVIGQAPVHSDQAGSDPALSFLLRFPGRTPADMPVATAELNITIEGEKLAARHSRYADPRIETAQFAWNEDRRIGIATWQYPLTPDLLCHLRRI
jgi:hypothetical protein